MPYGCKNTKSQWGKGTWHFTKHQLLCVLAFTLHEMNKKSKLARLPFTYCRAHRQLLWSMWHPANFPLGYLIIYSSAYALGRSINQITSSSVITAKWYYLLFVLLHLSHMQEIKWGKKGGRKGDRNPIAFQRKDGPQTANTLLKDFWMSTRGRLSPPVNKLFTS